MANRDFMFIKKKKKTNNSNKLLEMSRVEVEVDRRGIIKILSA
jgi:hypothetical protein